MWPSSRAASDGPQTAAVSMEEFNRSVALGYNVQWQVTAAALCALMLFVAVRERKAGRIGAAWLALGAAMAEGAVAGHRFFWAAASRTAEDGELYAAALTSSRWALWFLIQVSILGMIFMARPVLRYWLPRRPACSWWAIPWAVSLAIFVAAAVAL